MIHRLPMYALLQQLGGYSRCPAGQMPSAAKCMCSAAMQVSVEGCKYLQLVCSIRELALGSCSSIHACSTLKLV